MFQNTKRKREFAQECSIWCVSWKFQQLLTCGALRANIESPSQNCSILKPQFTPNALRFYCILINICVLERKGGSGRGKRNKYFSFLVKGVRSYSYTAFVQAYIEYGDCCMSLVTPKSIFPHSLHGHVTCFSESACHRDMLHRGSMINIVSISHYKRFYNNSYREEGSKSCSL